MARQGFLGRTGMLAGMGLGAGLMYYFDRQSGNRRRALARDKVARWSHQLNDALGVAARDLTHRLQGTLAETRSLFFSGEADTPQRLQARVRSKLGRHVSHPASINVIVEEGGRVILEGPILTHEVESLLAAVASVRGVTTIESRLETHQTSDDVPGLQGGADRPGERGELMQENWAPAPRLLVGGFGAGLMLNALRNPGLVNGFLGTLGLAMFARAATNTELGRLIGITGGRRAVDLQKTTNLDVPAEEVIKADYWGVLGCNEVE